MSAATNVIKSSLDMAGHCVNSYLEDLTDEDLFIRPAKGANHMAWQLGHLIAAENMLINAVCPGAMPPLPEGFAEKHDKNTAGSDDRGAFCSKQEYVKLMNEQRAGTVAALEKLTDEQLNQAAPEAIQSYCPTVSATFALQASHWLMHSGQWVVVRRMLGRDPLF